MTEKSDKKDEKKQVKITLEAWAKSVYGQKAPCLSTLRGWCRDGKIFPTPQKHGRSYFLEPDSRYIDNRIIIKMRSSANNEQLHIKPDYASPFLKRISEARHGKTA